MVLLQERKTYLNIKVDLDTFMRFEEINEELKCKRLLNYDANLWSKADTLRKLIEEYELHHRIEIKEDYNEDD